MILERGLSDMGHSESEAEKIKAKAEAANNIPVRIALFGQPGAGKSSLINAIVGEDVARTGVHTDTTQNLEEYDWNHLILCDLPGYGTEKFPVGTYFEKFKILSFDVFLCVSSGKFLEGDTLFYRELRAEKKPCIFVRNKADTLFQKGLTATEIKDQIVKDLGILVGKNEDVIFTSVVTSEGLDTLTTAILDALPKLKRDRFLRSAKAYSKDFLEEKRKACNRYIVLAAAAAAAANLAPVPGLRFAADLTAVTGLLTAIRMDFDLDVENLTAFEALVPAFGSTIQNVIKAASQEGVLWMMKRYAAPLAAGQLGQFIPFVGQAIAASISFGTIWILTSRYVDDCYEIAEKMLTERFGY
jgi:GTP-binding protein EngB required for normal cell division